MAVAYPTMSTKRSGIRPVPWIVCKGHGAAPVVGFSPSTGAGSGEVRRQARGALAVGADRDEAEWTDAPTVNPVGDKRRGLRGAAGSISALSKNLFFAFRHRLLCVVEVQQPRCGFGLSATAELFSQRTAYTLSYSRAAGCRLQDQPLTLRATESSGRRAYWNWMNFFVAIRLRLRFFPSFRRAGETNPFPNSGSGSKVCVLESNLTRPWS